MRHWSKKLTDKDLPYTVLSRLVTEFLQALRDVGKLVIVAKKMKIIVNDVIRLPTILLKSYLEKSILQSFNRNTVK